MTTRAPAVLTIENFVLLVFDCIALKLKFLSVQISYVNSVVFFWSCSVIVNRIAIRFHYLGCQIPYLNPSIKNQVLGLG